MRLITPSLDLGRRGMHAALFVALVRGSAVAQAVPLPLVTPSPTIEALRARIALDRVQAVTEFWSDRAKRGTPIIEPYGSDTNFILVTFVYRDTLHAKTILVSNGVAGWNEWSMSLQPIAGTDIWYKTVVLPSDVRIGYQFRVNDTPVPLWADQTPGRFATWHGDRLNPNVDSTTRVRGARSKFEGPRAVAQPYVNRRAGIPHGRIDSIAVDSKLLGQRRRAWVYTPPTAANRSPSAEAIPLLVMFDGGAYTNDAFVPTPTILDNLIADGKIRPVAGLFVDNGAARMQELGCDSTFAAFVVSELVPTVRQRYRVTSDPAQTIIGGSSHGALAATCAALRHPGTFGNVISQSGSYWWAPPNQEEEWVARTFATLPKLPVRFYLEVGVFEVDRSANNGPGQVLTSRHLRDVLRAKGYDVVYGEFPGAHEYYNWRGTLNKALEHFLPPR